MGTFLFFVMFFGLLAAGMPIFLVLGACAADGILRNWIASASARGTTIGLIVFGELMGIVSAIVSWAMQPHWFAIALLILYPIAVWIGYVIARRAPQGSQSARAAG